MNTISRKILLSMGIAAIVIIALLRIRYHEIFAVEESVLAITLVVILFYTYFTAQIAEVNSKTFKMTRQPLASFDIVRGVAADDILTTSTSALNQSNHPGALKIQLEFFLINNAGLRAFKPVLEDGITPNGYYNGTIAWYLEPRRKIEGTRFGIIPSLSSVIKNQDDLIRYYRNAGKLWMRIKVFCFDEQEQEISRWKQDWYFTRASGTQWQWSYEIDKDRLDHLLKD